MVLLRRTKPPSGDALTTTAFSGTLFESTIDRIVGGGDATVELATPARRAAEVIAVLFISSKESYIVFNNNHIDDIQSTQGGASVKVGAMVKSYTNANVNS